MERHNRELRRREKLGTAWTERNLLALLQKQGLKTNHLKRNATKDAGQRAARGIPCLRRSPQSGRSRKST